MTQIIAHALAKVNLALRITGKDEDGYHTMQSIFVFLKDVYDELIFYPEKEFDENSAKIPGIEDNSVIKAWEILRDNYKFKIPHVEIKKKIPICGGLGGGSSDAACFINSVFNFWGFSDREKLSSIALFEDLGADTRVFLFKYFFDFRSIYINGTGLLGELGAFDEFNFDGLYVVIANNGTKLSTKEVYKNLRGAYCKELSDRFDLLEDCHNSLEMAALKLEPSLVDVIIDLLNSGAMLARVSGSGSTCFGLFGGKTKAQKAKKMLNYPFVEISRI